jgi:hypothetical protein
MKATIINTMKRIYQTRREEEGKIKNRKERK